MSKPYKIILYYLGLCHPLPFPRPPFPACMFFILTHCSLPLVTIHSIYCTRMLIGLELHCMCDVCGHTQLYVLCQITCGFTHSLPLFWSKWSPCAVREPSRHYGNIRSGHHGWYSQNIQLGFCVCNRLMKLLLWQLKHKDTWTFLS